MQDRKLNSTIAKDTLKGLSSKNKFLSSKYFYDTKGSRIFQNIMRMPEYYLTDCELEIFENQKGEILKSILTDIASFDLIELGAGDGLKTKILLNYFLEEEIDFEYVPVDISKSVILELEKDLISRWPELKIRPLIGDYFHLLEELNQKENKPKVLLFLGSNIGNFDEEKATAFLRHLRNEMKEDDQIIIGFDLKKDPQIILKAYDDPHGFTAQFNLNLLERLNRELGANFNLQNFRHEEIYHQERGAACSFLVSQSQQSVFIEDLDEVFSFEENEKIAVEISQKYDEEMVDALAEKSGFQIVRNFYDKRLFYMNSLWKLKH